jgi:signal transduction histidine kinase
VDSTSRYQSWPKWLIAICACACFVFSESLHATEHKEVSILHSAGREFGPWNEYAKQIRAELGRQSPWPPDVREHSLETARSGGGVSKSRLPPGGQIYFREPTAWEKYPWQILLASAAILIQAMLIVSLLYQLRRHRFAEVQSRHRLSELTRANRFATAGELTASIAHEINQPLGAIQTNAETLDLMLRSSSPDIVEIKEIVADIRRDQERASEVIRRLRSLLKRSPFELKDVDLNEVVRETEKFVSSLSAISVARQVNLITSLTPEPLPITGDHIQLQQVILNLIVNAIDVMSDAQSAEPKITVRTTRIAGFAEVTVADAGPGIPADKLKEVFQPFFTTKAGGMGIGLSIARTIVEAHNGQIVAENQAGGGAVFRITLPLEKMHGELRTG